MGASQSKKALKAALKKRRMEKLPKGHRNNGSSLNKRGLQAPPVKAETKSEGVLTSSSPSPSASPSDRVPPAPPPSATSSKVNSPAKPQSQSRRLKVSLRESSGKRSLGRSRPGIHPSTNSTPATLHGRVLQKTASVSPAPPKPHVNTPTSLTRFGFKNEVSVIKSGNSTDSVNSILSDAQTTSDTNSNLWDFSEENGNPSTSESLTIDYSNSLTESSKVNIPKRSSSPCSVSQASSGVTSSASALNGRIRAQSKQLPAPQVVSLKSVGNSNVNVNANDSNSNQAALPNSKPCSKIQLMSSPNRRLSPCPNKPSSPNPNRTSSPAPKRLSDPPRKGLSPIPIRKASPSPKRGSKTSLKETDTSEVTQCSPKNSLKKSGISHGADNGTSVQVSPNTMPKNKLNTQISSLSKVTPKTKAYPSRNSRSSKSSSTFDSGLGSSSESDRLRINEACNSDSFAKETQIDCDGEKDEDTSEITEQLDLSDAWLQEKKSSLCKKKMGCFDLVLDSPGCFQLKHNDYSGTSTDQKSLPKETFKDKRDASITYGMARQKFAPYSRNRFGYQSSSQLTPLCTNQNKTSQLNRTPGGSVVRNRIAQLEKSPIAKNSEAENKKVPVKFPAKPTSLEKIPILVTPKIQNTVELSKPICRRLEYSEGKSSLIEPSKNSSDNIRTTAEDYLIVASVELKRDRTSLENKPSENKPFNEPATLENDEHSTIEDVDVEEKNRLDIIETEKEKGLCRSSAKGSDTTNYGLLSLPKIETEECLSPVADELLSDLRLSTEELSMKLSTPGSETSFEIIESLNDSLDFSSGENTLLERSIIDAEANLILALNLNGSDAEALNSQNVSTDPKLSACHDSPKIPPKRTRQSSREDDNNLAVNPSDTQHNSDANSNMDLSKRKDTFNTLARQALTSSISSNCSSKGCLDISTDSFSRSFHSSSTMADDKSTVSGKYTPSIGSTRGDMDQDFLIDDEISDQPDLVFGDAQDASLYADDDIFCFDLVSSSPSLLATKLGTTRSRPESAGTLSSLAADDLMLDYDLDDQRASIGSSSSQATVIRNYIASELEEREGLSLVINSPEISIPGPRYEEEVTSPVATEILNEFSAFLAEVQNRSYPQGQCISRESGVASSSPSIAGQPSSLNGVFPPRSSSPSGSLSRHRVPSGGCLDDDLSSDPTKKGIIFKPPRQGTPAETDGIVTLDRTSLHYICQDVTSLKTLLLRLKRILQVTDTINPFDGNMKTPIYLSLGASDVLTEKEDGSTMPDLTQENVDLKRQVVFLQQQLEEKNRSIRILHQQLSQALHQSTASSMTLSSSHSSATECFSMPTSSSSVSSSSSKAPHSDYSCLKEINNAATQTDRSSCRPSVLNLNSVSRASSIEDGLGPTVSSEMPSLTDRPITTDNNFQDDEVSLLKVTLTPTVNSFYSMGMESEPLEFSITTSTTQSIST